MLSNKRKNEYKMSALVNMGKGNFLPTQKRLSENFSFDWLLMRFHLHFLSPSLSFSLPLSLFLSLFPSLSCFLYLLFFFIFLSLLLFLVPFFSFLSFFHSISLSVSFSFFLSPSFSFSFTFHSLSFQENFRIEMLSAEICLMMRIMMMILLGKLCWWLWLWR